MLKLRAEEAAMLGYPNFAEVSLVPKMADSTAQVAGFLRELAAKATPFAERDIAELREFARTRTAAWTRWKAGIMAWASEKLKHARYAFSDEEVKQYFPEPKVLGGLFRVVEIAVRALRIEPDRRRSGIRTVRFFRIGPRRPDDRPVLRRSLRPRNQARRRLDGRRHRPPA